MECQRCHRTFQTEERLASISGSIMGDEHTDVYYLCPACGQYTIAQWWDDFTGVETMKASGPHAPEEVRRRLELIRQCPEPWDKKCRCQAHRDYSNDTLD